MQLVPTSTVAQNSVSASSSTESVSVVATSTQVSSNPSTQRSRVRRQEFTSPATVTITITRQTQSEGNAQGGGVLGEMSVQQNGQRVPHLNFHTLEPLFNPNGAYEGSGSSVPADSYTASIVDSPRFGANTVMLNDVPGRTAIIVGHAGNYATDSAGCVLIGEHGQLTDTGPAIWGSRSAENTLKQFIGELPPGSTIEVNIVGGESRETPINVVTDSDRLRISPEIDLSYGGDGRGTDGQLDVDGSGPQVQRDSSTGAWILMLFKLTIPFSSCVNGDTMILVNGSVSRRAGDLIAGDMVPGLAGADGLPAMCRVLSAIDHGRGSVAGDYTNDHFMVKRMNGTKVIYRYANTTLSGADLGPPEEAQLVNILTDCEAVVTQDEDAFTPISGTFCAMSTMTWAEYRAIYTAIVRIARGPSDHPRDLTFLMDPGIWHDNASNPSGLHWQDQLPALCESMMQCAGNGDLTACAEFDRQAEIMVVSNLEPASQETVKRELPLSPSFQASASNTPLLHSTIVALVVCVTIAAFMIVAMWKKVRRLEGQVKTGMPRKASTQSSVV